MGRTLIGGTAVATASPTRAASSGNAAYTGRPSWSARVEGLPLICGGSSSNSTDTSGARLGLEVMDSFGKIITTNSYMGTRGGGNFTASSAYSTTQSDAAGDGYAGGQYLDEYFYMQDNPSTSNRSSNLSQAGQAFNWTSWSNLGSRGLLVDLDYDTNSAYYEVRSYNNTKTGGFVNSQGNSSVLNSGSWIGAEGTRQEHSLVKRSQETDLFLFRNTRKGNKRWPETFYGHTKDPKDRVNWYDYTPDAFKADFTSATNAQVRDIHGSRFSYNENLNRLFVLIGTSTYAANNAMVIWDGASGKNLYDTPLQDWLEAATSTYLGKITSGFTNMNNNNDGYGGKSWLCNDGTAIISWKQTSNNRCYRLNTQPENALSVVATNMSPDGSTTSYSFDQGASVHTHEGFTTWDNKWLFLGWTYYYYHCGLMGIFVSLDDPSVWARYTSSDSSHSPVISPVGKSGFAISQTNNMTSTNGYLPVFDFSRTLAASEASGGTDFHYGFTQWSYSTERSAFSSGNYERLPNETEFDRSWGLINRTNINTGGTVDNSRGAEQVMPTPKHVWRVPTNYMGIAPLNYWYQTLPDGTDNTGARY